MKPFILADAMRDCEADIANLLAQIQQIGDAVESGFTGWNGVNLSGRVRDLRTRLAAVEHERDEWRDEARRLLAIDADYRARLAQMEHERDEARTLLKAGRHAIFGDLNRSGKTVLDMYNVWLDQAEARVAEVKRERDVLRNQVHNLAVQCDTAEVRVAALSAVLRDVTCAEQFGCDEKFCAYPDDCALDVARA